MRHCCLGCYFAYSSIDGFSSVSFYSVLLQDLRGLTFGEGVFSSGEDEFDFLVGIKMYDFIGTGLYF